ncbi:toxin glutamine deamidase domain-containing protein [Actinoallomurus bryophytorum]|uniref:toxin glutamine deamidase domain-containing protein n=1 Tax=Actinoallomurus bryophytorum TaxID=1490222 RepID=UPI00114DC8BF|nr:toxin glutamine deamidase domain-containing protein [Actinoallomurus bryophytorum]
MSGGELLTDLGVFRSAAMLFRGARTGLSVPGREFRPTGVENLVSGKLSKQQIQVLQKSRAEIQATLERMPGGVPRSAADVGSLLPHINPLRFENNCHECTLAVDDVLAGRAAVAGNSRPANGFAHLGVGSELTGSDPDSIERELLQSGDGARGIVLMTTKDGDAHSGNIANLQGKVYWMDGQISNLAANPDRIPIIVDKYPYYKLKPGVESNALIRTDGRRP